MMVLSAFVIPIALLLVALVVETGNWFTHKRQLQNRADAAALAAGVEYGRQIYNCLSPTSTEVDDAETEIRKAARAFAGDDAYIPDPSGLPDGLDDPVSANTQIADQLKVKVDLNSISYSDESAPDGAADDSDGGGPCYKHPAGTDDITPQGGQWVDVKVTENDTGAIWKTFRPDLHARARVEIRPAEQLSGFVPLGIPDNRIAKAQARFINECTGDTLHTVSLKPLCNTDNERYEFVGPG